MPGETKRKIIADLIGKQQLDLPFDKKPKMVENEQPTSEELAEGVISIMVGADGSRIKLYGSDDPWENIGHSK